MVVQSNPTATMTTSFGTLKIEIFENDVPETAGNFIDLIEKGFYNGLRFFDSKPNYTFSAGCPNSGVGAKQKNSPMIGSGGPVPGTEFKNRLTGDTVTRNEYGHINHEYSAKISNTFGTLTMANCGPNTAGSIFCVNLRDNSHLDWWNDVTPDQNIVFARVVHGMDDLEDLSHQFWNTYSPIIYKAVMDY
eukprot:TRINITY_DN5417_c0_g1_i1.p1 TRINITY_DN5417_c0_g1~~TRINITY_DN5417_c0_g1_i1.p1  ORF type:complete len:205 (+),score=27.96 TRINITY_DN5417_c0_g1_i1:48-617(+)